MVFARERDVSSETRKGCYGGGEFGDCVVCGMCECVDDVVDMDDCDEDVSGCVKVRE